MHKTESTATFHNEPPLSPDEVPSASAIFSIPYFDRQPSFQRAAREAASAAAANSGTENNQPAAYVSMYLGRKVTPPAWAAQGEADAEAWWKANKHLFPRDRDHIERPSPRALGIYAVATLCARMRKLLSRAEP
jgi:hypothetical protein